MVCLQLSRRCSNHLCNKNRGFENFLLATYNMGRGVYCGLTKEDPSVFVTPSHPVEEEENRRQWMLDKD